MIQGGDNGIVLPSGSMEAALNDSSKAVGVGAAGLGLIEPQGFYRTAVFEAFPRNPSTFIRGEGRSLAEAEESAWLQFQKIGSCPSHEFERRGYRTGAAICRHCGLFSSHALATTLDPCVVCGRDDNRASYGPDRHGRWHCEKCFRSIPEPDKSSIHRMVDRMRVAADASAARAAQARSTAEGI